MFFFVFIILFFLISYFYKNMFSFIFFIFLHQFQHVFPSISFFLFILFSFLVFYGYFSRLPFLFLFFYTVGYFSFKFDLWIHTIDFKFLNNFFSIILLWKLYILSLQDLVHLLILNIFHFTCTFILSRSKYDEA